jgi:uncharacterized SAM-binding protein YcdF (DUF218 family)
MLFLHKLLPIFVLPLGWVAILLAIALIRKKRWPVIVALAVLYVASLPYVGDRLTGALESGYPQVPLDQVEKADAIVPLSGILGPPAAHGCQGCLPNLGDANERLEAGIELWQLKKASYLIFTGGRIPWENQSEVEGAALRRIAVARGVPADKILVTGEVGHTDDEAHAVAAMIRERGWSKIILVTTAWHMPRAARLFRKAGVDIVPFPVDYRFDPQSPLTILDFLPSAHGLANTELALREIYGHLFYWFRRW